MIPLALRAGGALILGWVAAVSSIPSARAGATVTFRPAVFLGTSYVDNVQYLTVDSTAGTVASVGHRTSVVGVDLALQTAGRRTTLDLNYRPVYFKDHQEASLDNVAHFLRATLGFQATREVSLAIGLSFQRTQLQGRPLLGTSVSTDPGANPAPVPGTDVYLSPRTNRDSLSADLELSHRISSRWDWSVVAQGSRQKYEAIENFATTVSPALTLESRTNWGAGVQFSNRWSAENSWGLRYDYARVDMQQSGQDSTQRVGANLEHLMRNDANLSVEAGGYYRRGTGGSSADAKPTIEDSGFYVRGGWNRRVKRISVGLSVALIPTSGGAYRGTSVDGSVGVSVFGVSPKQAWAWSVSSQYSRRNPSDAALATLDTRVFSGSVEWRPSSQIGLRLSLDHGIQHSETESLNGRFSAASLGLVWNPVGHPSPRALEKEPDKGEPS